VREQVHWTGDRREEIRDVLSTRHRYWVHTVSPILKIKEAPWMIVGELGV